MAGTRARALSAVTALLLASAVARAQGQPQDTIELDTDLVVLDAQVLDKETGAAVDGLTREDFELSEDGVRQEVAYFSRDQLPLSVVILVDVSFFASVFDASVRENVLRALCNLKPEDEVALMAYGVDAELLNPFTRDRQLIAQKVERIRDLVSVDAYHKGKVTIAHTPGSALNVGVLAAATYTSKAASPAGRRVIVVATPDGKPVQVPFKTPSKGDVLRELFESGAVVYGLLVPGVPVEIPNVTTPIKMLLSRTGVGTYADETGGEVLRAGGGAAGARLADLVARLRTRYSLGYAPSNTRRDGKFRKIKLRVRPEVERRLGRLVVKTRKGYYAPGGSGKPVDQEVETPERPRRSPGSGSPLAA